MNHLCAEGALAFGILVSSFRCLAGDFLLLRLHLLVDTFSLTAAEDAASARIGGRIWDISHLGQSIIAHSVGRRIFASLDVLKVLALMVALTVMMLLRGFR